jgi:UDP-N-acetylmuramate--alanine ligase
MPESIHDLDLVLGDLSPMHLVGIGGVGMSAIATVLLERGLAVSGSDIKESQGVLALRAQGARVSIGHAAANISGARALVVSSAIRDSNPELLAARDKGIAVLHRAQVLGLLMRGRRGIAVAGTHGKTTTTSMITLALQAAGLDPTFLIGGGLNERGTNAHDGTGEWLVAEADESDASFLWLGPQIAVITNVEAEHLDHYRDEAEIRDTFLAFAANLPDDGLLVAGAEDPGARWVAERTGRRVVTVGMSEGDWTAERATVPGGQVVQVFRAGAHVGELKLSVPGEYNVRNALAAIAASEPCGVSFDDVALALRDYTGPRRRFQLRGAASGVKVVDDYSHHPTEVRAMLGAAREQAQARIIAIFQPHLYSRTAFFGDALGAALSAADVVVVTDIDGSREDPVPGITGKIVVDGALRARPRARVAYLPRRGDIAHYVASIAREGDLVVTIGAGDVTMLGDVILSEIKGRR